METLRYVVLANALLAVVSIAYYLLLRRETFFGANRLALWLGLAGALLLPMLELPDWRPERVRTVMHKTAQVIVPKVLPHLNPTQPEVTITFPDKKTYKLFRNPQAEFAWSWPVGLFLLYLTGVGLLLIRFGVQLVSLRRLIRQSDHEPYDDFTLVRNPTVSSPFSFFYWVALNSDQHTPDELEQILRHERVHVRDRHSFDMLGAELVCIVFWFNPAVYLFRQLLHQTLEFSADRAVLAEGVDARSYQYNLVKVSMGIRPQGIISSFNKSFLKPRIIMMNRSRSTRAIWLKYPTFLLATLTVATLFAQPKVHTIAKFLSRPAAQTLAKVISTESVKPQVSVSVPVESQQPIPLTAQTSVSNAALSADTVQKSTNSPDIARVSPSRYIHYEGDKLYWIITPKTSFDDLAVMKQEFEHHGYKMQVQVLKYDPLNAYITDIKITIIRPIVGVSDFEETGVDGGPIRSYGGYNGLNTLKAVAAVGSYPFNADFLSIPQELVQIARNEELSLAKFIHDNRLNYLMATGRKISNKYAPSSSTLNVSGLLAQPAIIRKYGIKLKADSTLDISNTDLPVFINNEPISNIAVKHIMIKKFDTLISSEEYGRNGQQGAVKALLFYTNDLH